MSEFYLIQRVPANRIGIFYKVETKENTSTVYLKLEKEEGTFFALIGSDFKESNRGWSYTTFSLTNKPLTIFLPRESFEKSKNNSKSKKRSTE